MNDVENTAGEGLAPEEKAYFESRGEVTLPVEETPSAPIEQQPSGQAAGEEEGREKTVPHGAFHEERQRRKQAEEKARGLELENAKAIARLEALLQSNQPKDEPAPQPPKVEEDIFGAVDYQGRKIETVEQRLERFEKAEQEAAQQRQIQAATAAAEQEFIRDNPDLLDAVNHLRAARSAELQVFGFTAEQAIQKIYQEERVLAAQALQRNQNPAALVYNWALQRGYSKKAPEAPREDPAKKLETLEAAQAANKTLSSAGGTAASGAITAMDLLKMSDGEFAAFRKSNPAKFRRIMAGAH